MPSRPACRGRPAPATAPRLHRAAAGPGWRSGRGCGTGARSPWVGCVRGQWASLRHHRSHAPATFVPRRRRRAAGPQPHCVCEQLHRQPAGLALAADAAHLPPALPRGKAGTHGRQPDLHDPDLAGAAADGDARHLHGLSDVFELPGGAGAVLPEELDSAQHRQAGAGRADAVRGQGQQARRGRPGGPGRQRAGADADHRPHAERDLAGSAPAADGPAGAGLLGRDDARPAAAGRQPDADQLCGQRRPGCDRQDAGGPCGTAGWRRHRAARPGHGRALPSRAQHPCALAPRLAWRRLRVGRLLAGEVSAGLVCETGADLFDAVRRLRDRTDLPDLDLSGLGHRAAGGDPGRQCTQPDRPLAPAAGHAGPGAGPGAGSVGRTVAGSRGGRQRPVASGAGAGPARGPLAARAGHRQADGAQRDRAAGGGGCPAPGAAVLAREGLGRAAASGLPGRA
mmetsp:Transcript_15047/g.35626  ORF Transcript_15047/g.35626 Transcript_15047/m.35626 type:complete len:454 (+) Transcript_15047:382-1743(+)